MCLTNLTNCVILSKNNQKKNRQQKSSFGFFDVECKISLKNDKKKDFVQMLQLNAFNKLVDRTREKKKKKDSSVISFVDHMQERKHQSYWELMLFIMRVAALPLLTLTNLHAQKSIIYLRLKLVKVLLQKQRKGGHL